jgi:hypothetical protein
MRDFGLLRVGQQTSIAATSLFNLTGIAVQYSFDAPADNEYRILPRGLFEIDWVRPRGTWLESVIGSTITALCYNLELDEEAAETNRAYAARLYALAGRLGLPEDCQEMLREMGGISVAWTRLTYNPAFRVAAICRLSDETNRPAFQAGAHAM